MPYADFDRFRYVDNSGEPDTVASVLASTSTDAPRGSAFGIMPGTGNFQDFFAADLQLPAGDRQDVAYARLNLHSPMFRLSNWMYHAPVLRRIQRVELSIDRMPGTPDYYRATRTIYLSRSTGVIDSPIVSNLNLSFTLDFPPNLPIGLSDPHVGGKPRLLPKVRSKKVKSGGKGKAGERAEAKSKKSKGR